MRALCLGVAFTVLGGSPASAQGSRWSLEPTSFAVGGFAQDPRYSLSKVVGASRLPDGRVVIADHFAQGVRLYAPDGEHLGSAGGEGEGPGEYQYIRGLGLCAEGRVVAFDLHWDMKIYDYDLDLQEERKARFPGFDGGPYNFACNPSGHYVATGWGDPRRQFRSGFYVAMAPVVLGRGDELIRDFGERLSSERVGTVQPNGEPAGSSPHPFGRQTLVAIGRERVYIGDSGDSLIEVYDLGGASVDPVTWPGPDREVTDRDWAAYEEAQLADAPESRQRALRRYIRDLPRIDLFPAFDRLAVDRAGNLWVRQFPKPGSRSSAWLVFDPCGQMIGHVELAAAITLLEAGEDYALVVEKDELDVETVRLMRLVK